MTRLPPRNTAFAALRRFARSPAPAPAERCELCGLPLAEEHLHLIELANRRLVCACDPCAILFENQGAGGGGKYRRVPRRVRLLSDFRMSDGQWDSLMIPINLAFFFHSTPAGRVVALYPSPAGPTESLLSLESWEEIVRENPVLADMQPDVESLLVNRVRSARDGTASAEYYVVPIDQCYKLVGLIRARWHGLSGGSEVWEAIAHFFAELNERSSPYREASRA
jgi:hypothetical protein